MCYRTCNEWTAVMKGPLNTGFTIFNNKDIFIVTGTNCIVHTCIQCELHCRSEYIQKPI